MSEGLKFVISDKDNFDNCLDKFIEIVCKNTDTKITTISFCNKGFLKTEEGYKRDIFKAAGLMTKNAAKLKRGGKKQVTEKFIKAVEFDNNNLLDWREKQDLKKKLAENKDIAEDLIYRIYTEPESNDEILFNEAIGLLGQRYPILSFMFFLKDIKNYVPVKPEKFKERFEILGLNTECLKECTWDNYQRFITIIRDVQKYLNKSAHFNPSVELIDAHSYIWMMWHLNDNDETESIEYDSEGNIKFYYGTRYERSSKNRAAAIKIHGCKCMACGFDFEEKYGKLGKDFIEVHHIKPLSTYSGREQKINPTTDLICLCSNCHRMIHRRKGAPYTLEELKAHMKI